MHHMHLEPLPDPPRPVAWQGYPVVWDEVLEGAPIAEDLYTVVVLRSGVRS